MVIPRTLTGFTKGLFPSKYKKGKDLFCIRWENQISQKCGYQSSLFSFCYHGIGFPPDFFNLQQDGLWFDEDTSNELLKQYTNLLREEDKIVYFLVSDEDKIKSIFPAESNVIYHNQIKVESTSPGLCTCNIKTLLGRGCICGGK